MSDVELISVDGSRFHAHRLVLCAQSPVFKSMLDSELWVESRNKEVGCLMLIALPLSMATRILNTAYTVCLRNLETMHGTLYFPCEASTLNTTV